MDDARSKPPGRDAEPLELPAADGGREVEADGPVELPVVRDEPPNGVSGRVQLPQEVRAEWSQGRTDFRRWRFYGCLAGTLVLIALLVVGTQMVRNTVWLSFAQSHRRLAAELGGLPPAERVRTTQNLQRLGERLRAMDDPYPTIGEFQRRVRQALADGRLSPDEAASLNAFMEEAVAPPPERAP